MLITRPKAASMRFLETLEQVAGPFSPLVCPAFDLVGTGAGIPTFDIAVFTSRAGVSFAPAGANRVAYCVGDATAQAATQAGYVAISAAGSATELCVLILNDAPHQKLLHLRGEVSRGDVRKTLVEGGLDCAQAVVYRKRSLSIDETHLAEIGKAEVLLIPVFSVETVSILQNWPVKFRGCHVVAISQDVADAAVVFSPASVVVSDAPNLPSMIAQTRSLIA